MVVLAFKIIVRQVGNIFGNVPGVPVAGFQQNPGKLTWGEFLRDRRTLPGRVNIDVVAPGQ